MFTMSLQEFTDLITKEQPALNEVSAILEFAQKSDTEVIWEALQTSGVHAIVIALLTNVLQQKIEGARNALRMPPGPDARSLESMTGNPEG
ncbi:MAG: hypothetical protein JWR25_44 [Noviherbaspirillum sp.]|jgi:hypothetical protein|nr:hypothetical protein [Noviherbaspirillum sp.]